MTAQAAILEDNFLRPDPNGFVAQVDANLDQAVAEGWVRAKTTATTVMITMGVLMSQAEAVLGEDAVRALRRYLIAIVGSV